MEKRRIDLSRCLVRDGKADCHRCEEICPQKAINGHVVDTAACDGCGLCSAICPAAAIVAPEDYEGALTKAQELAPQVLMCEKASEGSVHCLGFLTRRLLWALAAKRPLALDISHCASCRPAVFAHL
uniref:4Fe-4S binding protein n=1 Tax=Mitsuokella multacida TaxID=52226 RepID=UPI0022E1477C